MAQTNSKRSRDEEVLLDDSNHKRSKSETQDLLDCQGVIDFLPNILSYIDWPDFKSVRMTCKLFNYMGKHHLVAKQMIYQTLERLFKWGRIPEKYVLQILRNNCNRYTTEETSYLFHLACTSKSPKVVKAVMHCREFTSYYAWTTVNQLIKGMDGPDPRVVAVILRYPKKFFSQTIPLLNPICRHKVQWADRILELKELQAFLRRDPYSRQQLSDPEFFPVLDKLLERRILDGRELANEEWMTQVFAKKNTPGMKILLERDCLSQEIFEQFLNYTDMSTYYEKWIFPMLAVQHARTDSMCAMALNRIQNLAAMFPEDNPNRVSFAKRLTSYPYEIRFN